MIRIERDGHVPADPARQGRARPQPRTLVRVDLKSEKGVARVRELVRDADGLIEGFRPGVMERLGLGPDVLLADNPRLVYGRMTGWGQDGPLAQAAGHDINYIALAGNLHGYGRAGGKPTPPINAVGDFGGGGMLLAFAMLAGILSARAHRAGAGDRLRDGRRRGLDRGHDLVAQQRRHVAGRARREPARQRRAPSTTATECADGKLVAIGALEPQFFALLAARSGLDAAAFRALILGLRDRFTAHLPQQDRATNGAPCSKAATPASRRCCRWPRRPAIRTIRRAAPSPSATA